MKLDVQQVLRGAEAIYLQLSGCPVGPGLLLVLDLLLGGSSDSSPLQDLPVKVQQVLGLYSPSSPEGSPHSQTSDTDHVVDQFQAG